MQLQALITAFLWLLLFWKKDGISSAAEPGYLDFDNLPETNFSCESKVIGGYYADVETGCQMFHVCTIGQKGEITDIKFLCLNGTVFDQETRVCERLDEVDCSKTESFFDLNLQLYGNKAGPFGIEPENEEIVEEECDPEDEEECQRTEDGGVREDDDEEGGVRETVPSNNKAGVIQQTTFSPASVATTTTKRPNLFSSTSTARVPTTTLQPSTTGQPQFQSGDPDTIAALLALHNAFAQSLQHHDINNKQQQEQQLSQQQEQIEQQQREIEEHQRKQHLQQLQQQKQQAQLQHQQAQLQHHQAQLHHQQQKITQQHAKQAVAAYTAAVNSQAPQPQTPKPAFPPPPPPLPRPPPLPQQIPQTPQHRFPSQSHYDATKHASSTPQAPQHRFPPQIHYDASKTPSSTPQQDPQHRFPPQIHYDASKTPSSTPQQDPQHRFPPQIHYDASKTPSSTPQQDPQHRYQPQISYDASKQPPQQDSPQNRYQYEAPKLPTNPQQQERFGGAYVQSQQNFGQNLRLPVQNAERAKPFSFHQYDSPPSTTASPYLLHQLKVNRVKQEQQQHHNFPRQAQRSITTPSVAVVTSTSTTTSIRSGGSKKGGAASPNSGAETFLGSSVTSSSSEVQPGANFTSGEYDEYQEGELPADPFFQDVPKIGRLRRDVEEVAEGPKSRKVGRHGEKGGHIEFFQDSQQIGKVGRDVSEKDSEKTIKIDYKRDGKLKSFNKDSKMKNLSEHTLGFGVEKGLGVGKNLEETENVDETFSDNKKSLRKKGGSVNVGNNSENVGKTVSSDSVVDEKLGENYSLSSDRLENINIYKLVRKFVKREAKYVQNENDEEEDEDDDDNLVGRRSIESSRSKNVRNSSKNSKKSDRNRSKTRVNDNRVNKIDKDRRDRNRYVEPDEEDDDVRKVRKINKVGSKVENKDRDIESEEEVEDNEEEDEEEEESDREKLRKTNNIRNKIKSEDGVEESDEGEIDYDEEYVDKDVINSHKGGGSKIDRDRDVESDEEDVNKDVGKIRKSNKTDSSIKTTTTQNPMETATNSDKAGKMKIIPLENNEFTDIIDKVEQTISAKVVSIKQNKGVKDNLQLSPEERKYYAEVSAVMSKYIPPTDNGDSLEGASTPNMSARDKQRLSMFVTSKEKMKKKNIPVLIRYRRQASKNKKQYEVSEVVDEPTTEEPSARRLINQYRTSGVVPSQLISELIQRMDITSFNSKEQTQGVSVTNVKLPQTSGPRTQPDEKVRNRALLPRRNYERTNLGSRMKIDPNTQSLRDVISNGGHHRMVLQGRSSSNQEQQDETVPRKSQSVQPKLGDLSSEAHTLKNEDSNPGDDYSLEKEESSPEVASISRKDEKASGNKDTYAVSEEDVVDVVPSTNRPFLYPDQIGRANTGDARFSHFDEGSLPVGGDGSSLDKTNERQEPTRTNFGSQEITRIRSRPDSSHRQTTKVSSPVAETGSELGSGVGTSVATPRRRRPTSRGREKPNEPVETSSELSSTRTGSRRRRPTSRVQGNSEEESPKEVDTRKRQPQRSRSRENSNLSVGTPDVRSRGRTTLIEESSRLSPDSSRTITGSSRSTSGSSRSFSGSSRTVSDSSRSAPGSSAPVSSRSSQDSSRPFSDSSRSAPGSSRAAHDSSRSSQDSSRSFSDSSRTVSDSSRSAPGNSRAAPDSSRSSQDSSRPFSDNSRPFSDSSRTISDSLRPVTRQFQSRRRPSNYDSEKDNLEEEVPVTNTQVSRENRISRTRRPPLLIPKEISTTPSDQIEEEENGETTDSYDSQAKKLHSQLFPGENFSCEGKIKGGFYADIESDCRGFFICSQGEINGPLLKSHFWCGEATKFNQRSRTCQADYLVECSISTRYFGLNNDFAVPTIETDTFEPTKIT